MKIYLGCTVRGDRSTLDVVRHIASRLTGLGHEVLTLHLLADDVDGDERVHTSREVYERDLAWVESCDVLIAEASGSSYGVGFEVGYVLGRSDVTGQHVLLLYDDARRTAVSRLIARTGQTAYVFYRKDRHDVISRLISGLTNAHGRVFAYESIADVDAALTSLPALRPSSSIRTSAE